MAEWSEWPGQSLGIESAAPDLQAYPEASRPTSEEVPMPHPEPALSDLNPNSLLSVEPAFASPLKRADSPGRSTILLTGCGASLFPAKGCRFS